MNEREVIRKEEREVKLEGREGGNWRAKREVTEREKRNEGEVFGREKRELIGGTRGRSLGGNSLDMPTLRWRKKLVQNAINWCCTYRLLLLGSQRMNVILALDCSNP